MPGDYSAFHAPAIPKPRIDMEACHTRSFDPGIITLSQIFEYGYRYIVSHGRNFNGSDGGESVFLFIKYEIMIKKYQCLTDFVWCGNIKSVDNYL